MRNKLLQERAASLRKNATDAERQLWKHLRYKQLNGARFRRQVVIDTYIADFVCLQPMLAIELDGGQHQAQQDYDQARTRCLQQRGFRVLRFWNNEVLQNPEGVLSVIQRTLSEMGVERRPPP